MTMIYFSGVSDQNWDNLNNWFYNSARTVPATGLPTINDDVYLYLRGVTAWSPTPIISGEYTEVKSVFATRRSGGSNPTLSSKIRATESIIVSGLGSGGSSLISLGTGNWYSPSISIMNAPIYAFISNSIYNFINIENLNLIGPIGFDTNTSGVKYNFIPSGININTTNVDLGFPDPSYKSLTFNGEYLNFIFNNSSLSSGIFSSNNNTFIFNANSRIQNRLPPRNYSGTFILNDAAGNFINSILVGNVTINSGDVSVPIVGDVVLNSGTLYSNISGNVNYYGGSINENTTISNNLSIYNNLSVNNYINANKIIFNDNSYNLYNSQSGLNLEFYDNSYNIGYSNGTIIYSGLTGSNSYGSFINGEAQSLTLYFSDINNSNGDWLTQSNWWLDNTYSTQSPRIPIYKDNVLISSGIITNANNLWLNSLTVNNSSISIPSLITLNSGNNIIFNGESVIDGANFIQTNNGMILNDNSYFNGNSLGSLGIYGSGIVSFNDDSRYNGDFNKINLDINWNGYNGYYSNDDMYYIGGRSTTLDSSGSGWDSYTSTYYINGIAATTLDQYGSGFWDGHAYYYGSLQPSGYNEYYYYIDDVETSLDSNGSGFWDGHAYYYGSLQPSGYNGYYYYIDDVETSLDSNGTGDWDGYNWQNGIRQVVGSIFVGTDSDWDNLANWIDINDYPATELPNSSTDITVTRSIGTIATQNPTVNSLIVENTATISIDITVTTSSTFNDSSSYSSGYHLYSDIIIFNNSSSAGGNIHPTTSITFNNSSSASGLSLDPLRVYLESGYLNITGFPINPASLNISNDTSNNTNFISFSRTGLGVNGSNILGLI